MFDGRRQDPTDEVLGCMLLSLHGRCGLELSCRVNFLKGSITSNLNEDGSRRVLGGSGDPTLVGLIVDESDLLGGAGSKNQLCLFGLGLLVIVGPGLE